MRLPARTPTRSKPKSRDERFGLDSHGEKPHYDQHGDEEADYYFRRWLFPPPCEEIPPTNSFHPEVSSTNSSNDHGLADISAAIAGATLNSAIRGLYIRGLTGRHSPLIVPLMRTRTFRSGNSQAVRLPAELAYPENTEVEVTRMGDVVTISPAPQGSMKQMVEELNRLPSPSAIERHVPIEVPDRERN